MQFESVVKREKKRQVATLDAGSVDLSSLSCDEGCKDKIIRTSSTISPNTSFFLRLLLISQSFILHNEISSELSGIKLLKHSFRMLDENHTRRRRE